MLVVCSVLKPEPFDRDTPSVFASFYFAVDAFDPGGIKTYGADYLSIYNNCPAPLGCTAYW
jgi:hypothetical protein